MKFWRAKTGLSMLEYLIGVGIVVGVAFTTLFFLQDSTANIGEKIGDTIKASGGWAIEWKK